MLALKKENITTSFLSFADMATHLLHIKTKNEYNNALETIEYLFVHVQDTVDDPLNDLIDMISRAIEKYEAKQDTIITFVKKANGVNQEISVLKTLMQQHGLGLCDLRDEIGSKPLVSMILNGKRNLTKEHIAKLSKRFNISPALFYAGHCL